MNLGLIGHGKLGKAVEQAALLRGWKIGFTQDSKSSVDESAADAADVVLHAATAASVLPSVYTWASRKKPIVIGTTGWYEHRSEVRAAAESNGIGIVYASNFSVGVHVFFRLLHLAGMMMDRLPEYDAYLREAHHREKLDTPSGTALGAANILIGTMKRKKEIAPQPMLGAAQADQLQIASVRAGRIVGEHAAIFDSQADTIEIRHNAKNRDGFAHGALLAAEWIRGKSGLFTMEDVLEDHFT